MKASSVFGWLQSYTGKIEKCKKNLLYAMGIKQAVQTVNAFKWAVNDDGDQIEADSDFNVLTKTFSEYFLPKRNIIHDRSMFNSRTQQESETVEELVSAEHFDQTL